MKLESNPEVKTVFESYPEPARSKLLALRKLIIESAEEIESITHMQEDLRWGEPSYLVDKGSTVRIAWKEKKPDQYSMFFKCTSKLVPAFRKLYSDKINIIGDREFSFEFDEKVPEKELKTCIKAALQYHKVKTLPELGITQ